MFLLCTTLKNYNNFLCGVIITSRDSLVYYNVQWAIITKSDSFLLQIATGNVEGDDYYEVRQ